MSGELRAPDPTLSAYNRSGEPYAHGVLVGGTGERVPVAHRYSGRWRDGGPEAQCGAKSWLRWSWLNTSHARWFCRPCRRCWPGAPLPGRGPHLSWQVPS